MKKKQFWADKKKPTVAWKRGGNFSGIGSEFTFYQGSCPSEIQHNPVDFKKCLLFRPFQKKRYSEQTLYFCSYVLLCEFVGRLLNVTNVTRTPHLEKKCLWREKNKEQRIRCGAQNPEHTTKVSSGKRAAKNGLFHISSSLKACQSHLELYHWCWSDIAETSCSKCTPWGPRTPMPLTLFKTNPSHLPMAKHTLQAILATIPGGWCKSPLILISWNHLIEGKA